MLGRVPSEMSKEIHARTSVIISEETSYGILERISGGISGVTRELVSR